MKKIKLTQGKVALVDDIDYEYLMQWKWYAKWDRNCFRARRHTSISDGKRTTLYMHTAIAERMGIIAKIVDHKDRNSLNNCRSNLRAASDNQNQHNRGTPKNSSTGVKGVGFYEASQKYLARIRVEGKYFHLGYFDTLKEAAAVVQKKRKELVGEFACA